MRPEPSLQVIDRADAKGGALALYNQALALDPRLGAVLHPQQIAEIRIYRGAGGRPDQRAPETSDGRREPAAALQQDREIVVGRLEAPGDWGGVMRQVRAAIEERLAAILAARS